MKTINDEWDDYMAKVMPRDAGEVQIRETRQAFASGAFALMVLLQTHSDEEGIAILENLQASMELSVANARRRASHGN